MACDEFSVRGRHTRGGGYDLAHLVQISPQHLFVYIVRARIVAIRQHAEAGVHGEPTRILERLLRDAVGERQDAGTEQLPDGVARVQEARAVGEIGVREQHLRDRHQLLTVAAGDSTVRILPPLVIGDAEIDEFFDKLSAGAADYQPPTEE